MRNDRLKRNTLPDFYVFDHREGRRVSPELVTIAISKMRAETVNFMEGVQWTLSNMVGYRAKVPNVIDAAMKQADKLYPPYEE